MRKYLLAVIMLSVVLMFTSGCLAKVGVVAPTWGKGETSFSAGADLNLPLAIPDKVGKVGTMLVIPYEEYRTPIEHQSGFSKGSLRTNTLGAEFRLMYMLFYKDQRAKEKAITGETEQEVMDHPKLHRHRDKTLTFFWFGAGPEYHWNSFALSSNDIAVAASNSILYDEKYKNAWGGRVSFGIQTMTRTHGPETGIVTGGIGLRLEFGYHFGYTWDEIRGTDNGTPFRIVREEMMEWFSSYVGLLIEF